MFKSCLSSPDVFEVMFESLIISIDPTDVTLVSEDRYGYDEDDKICLVIEVIK